jgi:hypothetical protein
MTTPTTNPTIAPRMPPRTVISSASLTEALTLRALFGRQFDLGMPSGLLVAEQPPLQCVRFFAEDDTG